MCIRDRHAIADYLTGAREVVTLVRVNPLDGHLTVADVAAIIAAQPDAIMLPKAEGAPSIAQLDTIIRSETPRDASLPPIPVSYTHLTLPTSDLV